MDKYRMVPVDRCPNDKVSLSVDMFRIKALRSFNDVSEGDLGGYVQGPNNLEQEGRCWIYGDACVLGEARVLMNARVANNAVVRGMAIVTGWARVLDRALVEGEAIVTGRAHVMGSAVVGEMALLENACHVAGAAVVKGNARVYGEAWVCGSAIVMGHAAVGGTAQAELYARLLKGTYESGVLTHRQHGVVPVDRGDAEFRVEGIIQL
jgi:carbonic anhydrase/acetyltransferase-like protein (isoleucine patch superfamily)